MFDSSSLESWGRYNRSPQRAVDISWRSGRWPTDLLGSVIPFGQGRSYGDVAQSTGGTLLRTRGLDRFIAFDGSAGVLRAESGVRLADALNVTTPHGWYFPVVPGTKQVSLGGAVANDVHGKNHHRAGTFGHHVRRFELLRSDGCRLVCSRDENPEWFAATVGGLGLTGLITWVEISLHRTNCHWVDVETVAINGISDFIKLCNESDLTHEYTVAWFDCFSAQDGAFRGLFTRANPSVNASPNSPSEAFASVFIAPPFGVLHPTAMRAFNRLYHHRGQQHVGTAQSVPLDRFLYPLDRVGHWNRLYGPKGFLQLQCVIPNDSAAAGTTELLDIIGASGQGTFLGVIKRFGTRPSVGLLSFPREGITVALDFPFRGPETLELFTAMHAVVDRHDGRIYPAKDACMTSATFQRGFPEWRRMQHYVDPAFGSNFWRRVTGQGATQ